MRSNRVLKMRVGFTWSGRGAIVLLASFLALFLVGGCAEGLSAEENPDGGGDASRPDASGDGGADGATDASGDGPPASCTNAIQDGDETGDDCGGSCPTKCADGQGCEGPGDCESGVCTEDFCQAPTCDDATTNGDETDEDCGGSCPTKCADEEACAQPTDCVSGVCTGEVCQAPTCSDGAVNGSETDEDCGGSCPKCGDGQACSVPADCTSGTCVGELCAPASCTDNVQNNTETDVDCGGSCPGCPTDDSCNVAGDCLSGVCTGNVCQASSCSDGVRNGTESAVDCGGSCSDCPNGQSCNGNSDCQSDTCINGTCQAQSCTDNIQNQDERGIDCGGVCANQANGFRGCSNGTNCSSNLECQSRICNNGSCVACATTVTNVSGTCTCRIRETTSDRRAYRFCAAATDWVSARDNCELVGMKLVRLDNLDENSWVRSNNDSIQGYEPWIGANDRESEGVWRWADGTQFWNGNQTGSATSGRFEYWNVDGSNPPNRTEPSGGTGENCAAYVAWYLGNRERWWDAPCTESRYFICEAY